MTKKANDNYSIKQKITNSIYTRLIAWGNQEWLSQKTVAATAKCFSKFYKEVGKKGVIEKIRGWDCALGQILDIDNAQIFSVLPYILTAYMYNFGEPFGLRGKKGKNNRFVKRYTEPLLQTMDLNYEDSTFFGASPLSKTQVDGVGKLLAGEFNTDLTREKKRLELLAHNFVFPETIEIAKANGVFIVPNTDDDIEEFERLCKLRKLVDLEDRELLQINVPMLQSTTGEHISRQASKKKQGQKDGQAQEPDPVSTIGFYPNNTGYREYRRDAFRWLFLTWYYIWHKFSDSYSKDDSVHKLDPLLCNSLMTEALCLENEDAQQGLSADKLDKLFIDTYKKGIGQYKNGDVFY